MKSKVAQRMESKIPEETKVFVDNYAKELNKSKFMQLVSKIDTNCIKNIKFRRKFRLYYRLKSYVILLYLNCYELWKKKI